MCPVSDLAPCAVPGLLLVTSLCAVTAALSGTLLCAVTGVLFVTLTFAVTAAMSVTWPCAVTGGLFVTLLCAVTAAMPVALLWAVTVSSGGPCCVWSLGSVGDLAVCGHCCYACDLAICGHTVPLVTLLCAVTGFC